MDNLIVWLIDDNPMNNLMIEKLMYSYSDKIKTVSFDNAKTPISLLNSDKISAPNLILLDLYLPEYSGIDFINDFRQLNLSETKIIVITSTNQIKDIETVSLYNLKYLPRPLFVDDLEDIFGKKDEFNSVKNMLRFLSKN